MWMAWARLRLAGPSRRIPAILSSGYRRFELNMRFTPGAPGQIRQVSGNNQTAQAGQALASPLVVEVLTASGGAMAGQAVNWTVSPAAGGNLGSAQTTTDSSGRTSNTLRFPTSATGPVVVTATLAADTTKTTTFTATAAPLITVTSMSIVSGNSQNAILNTSFSPLVVQVNSTAGPASGVAGGILDYRSGNAVGSVGHYGRGRPRAGDRAGGRHYRARDGDRSPRVSRRRST